MIAFWSLFEKGWRADVKISLMTIGVGIFLKLIFICSKQRIAYFYVYFNVFLTNATQLRYYGNMKQYTEEITDILKANNLRMTKTRMALIEILLCSEDPLSVSDILLTLFHVKRSVNKTTVYRELEQLESKGIVSTVQLGDRKQYYELASRDHHHHLICLECKQIEDIDMNEERLFSEEKKMSREKGFVILRHSLEFFGLCRSCQIPTTREE